MLGKFLANKGLEDYFFALADQSISFSLDEKGVATTTEARLFLKKGPCDNLYLFDRPFLVYMKEKNSSEPYLAIWLADAEFLIPFSKEEHPK